MLSTTGGKLKISPKKILQNYNKIKRLDSKKNLVSFTLSNVGTNINITFYLKDAYIPVKTVNINSNTKVSVMYI